LIVGKREPKMLLYCLESSISLTFIERKTEKQIPFPKEHCNYHRAKSALQNGRMALKDQPSRLSFDLSFSVLFCESFDLKDDHR
jgi:hypothetical protein